ncbi:MAG: CRISPR-associated protein Cmr3 [Herpetosiphonaceae bacterium]|nr:CRISPR-associated protein Cmr3 [Herpetosiphonaceae bacterium]
MTTWIIEPHDPLIVRDGRPFGPIPGARASSLAFPFPSTTTGGLRNRAGLDSRGVFDRSRIDEVKALAVRGPLLVVLNDANEIENCLLPAPADGLLLAPQLAASNNSQDTTTTNTVTTDASTNEATSAIRKRLVPLALPQGAETNLPGGLAPVGLLQPDPRKPLSNPPHFWYWERYKQWLLNPELEDAVKLSELGVHGPLQEQRTHVSIDPASQAAREGALFQTRGLEFTGSIRERMALALITDQDSPAVRAGLAPLGGERRIVDWRVSQSLRQTPPLACPIELRTAVKDSGFCRVLLLTPACFSAGFMPAWLLRASDGSQRTVQAVALQRPQVVSGWDFAANGGRGSPKPTRRLAPAGTVYFLKLAGGPEIIEQWIDQIWMQCVSDDAQDRHDGFGLALIGSWDGQLHLMQQQEQTDAAN